MLTPPRAVALMKRGRKVVCGSQEGVLDIFDYSDIEDISDRFPGHPSSVDALLALDDDIVMTGSSDGVIRIISILPNKMLGARSCCNVSQRDSHPAVCVVDAGVVGQHSDWPVERLACSADGLLLASAVRAALRCCPRRAGLTQAAVAVARQHGEAVGDRLFARGCWNRGGARGWCCRRRLRRRQR